MKTSTKSNRLKGAQREWAVKSDAERDLSSADYLAGADRTAGLGQAGGEV
jgi:hypothetical protein